MEFVRIEKINLVDAVCQQLREKILSGEMPEGTKFESENELARSFSVSRVVIREALQQLRTERLIVTRHGVGTYVANPGNFVQVDKPIDLSEQTYRDFLAFRNAVEITAIELSREAGRPEDYDRIDACVERMRLSAMDSQQYSDADYSFHLEVVRSGHNSFLERAMLANQNAITSVLTEMNRIPDAHHFGETTHQEIGDALRRKDTRSVQSIYSEMSKYNLARLQVFFKNNS